MRSGDWGNLFILANSGLFLASVILQNAGVVDWHSASFVEDGFCVTAPKTWRSSHAMSFYADAVGAGALAYLARKYAGEPFAEPVKDAAPGVFMHGLAHLLTWYHGDKPKIAEADDETKTTKMAMGVVFYTAFYFFLLKSKTPAAHAFGHGLWNALVLVFLVPPTFGFTYVQTSLLWVVALYELLKTKKDRYYDLWALTVGSLPAPP